MTNSFSSSNSELRTVIVSASEIFFLLVQASSPHSQHQTVDVSQLQDPHGYSQHAIQVQHIQVTEPSGPGQTSTQVKFTSC